MLQRGKDSKTPETEKKARAAIMPSPDLNSSADRPSLFRQGSEIINASSKHTPGQDLLADFSSWKWGGENNKRPRLHPPPDAGAPSVAEVDGDDDADSTINTFFALEHPQELRCCLQRVSSAVSRGSVTTGSASGSIISTGNRPNHILVGYAFGPKKMSTMSLIMAEASNALEAIDSVCGDSAEDASLGSAGTAMSICDQVEKRRLASCSSQTNHHSKSAAVQSTSGLQCEDLGDDRTVVTCGTTVSRGAHVGNMQRLQGGALAAYSAGTSSDAATKRIDDGCHNTPRTTELMDLSTVSSSSGRSTLTGTTITAVHPKNYLSSPQNNGHQQLQGLLPLWKPSSATNMSSAASFSSTNSLLRSSVRVSFVPLDLDCPLEEQHGGNFDVILHKLTEDILCVSEHERGENVEQIDDAASVTSPRSSKRSSDYDGNETCRQGHPNFPSSSTSTCKSVAREEAETRLSRLTNYKRDHPACCLVDDPDKIKSLMSRADIANVLSRCLDGVTTKSGIAVRTPRFLVCLDNDDEVEDTNLRREELARRLDTVSFTYPLIAKPLTAAGTKASHKMVIALGRQGLSAVQTPCLLQEYLNHDARLFKVYVLGDDVRVFERTSLPNLPRGERMREDSNSGNDCDDAFSYVEFDSQKPYPKLSDFGVNEADTRRNPIGKAGIGGGLPCRVTSDEIRPIASVLRRAFGLSLFGFDILVSHDYHADNGEEEGVSPPEMLVVDVNYFPSYKEVSNFPALLARYLTQRAARGRREWHNSSASCAAGIPTR